MANVVIPKGQPVSFETLTRDCFGKYDKEFCNLIQDGDTLKMQGRISQDDNLICQFFAPTLLDDIFWEIYGVPPWTNSGASYSGVGWAFEETGDYMERSIPDYSSTKIYQLNITAKNFGGVFEGGFEVYLGGTLISTITGPVVDYRVITTGGSSNDKIKILGITSGTDANFELTRIAVSEVNSDCFDYSLEMYIEANSLYRNQYLGSAGSVTYNGTITTGQRYSVYVSIVTNSGDVDVNLFGTTTNYTSSTIINSVYLATTDIFEINVSDDWEGSISSIVITPVSATFTLVDFDDTINFSLLPYITYYGDWINILIDFEETGLPYGCYKIKLDDGVEVKYSNCIDYREYHECTKVVEGYSEGYSFDFLFAGGFTLWQRLKCETVNPRYPIRQNNRLGTEGRRYRGYAEKDTLYIAMFDYMNSPGHETLATQVLCNSFFIDEVEWFYAGNGIDPRWQKDGELNYAQVQIELLDQKTVHSGSCSDAIIPEPPVSPCEGVLELSATVNGPLCEINGDDLEFDVNNTGTGTAVAWSWSGPDGFTSSIKNPTIPVATRDATGLYTVTVTSSDGCQATTTVNAIVGVSPILTIVTQTPDTGGGNGSATVKPTTPINPPYVYYLDGNPAPITSEGAPDHEGIITGLTAGLHTIMVEDENGCTDEIDVTIL